MSEFTDKIDELVVHLETAAAALAYAEKRIAELETALGPFAKRADDWKHNGDDARVSVKLGDLRRAHSALNPPKITGVE